MVRVGERKKTVRHGRRGEPLMARQREEVSRLAARRVERGCHRRVGPHVRTALFLCHAHTQRNPRLRFYR